MRLLLYPPRDAPVSFPPSSSKLFQTGAARQCRPILLSSIGDQKKRKERRKNTARLLSQRTAPTPAAAIALVSLPRNARSPPHEGPVGSQSGTQTHPPPRVQSGSRNGSCINARSQTRMIIPSWLPAATRASTPTSWARARAPPHRARARFLACVCVRKRESAVGGVRGEICLYGISL